MEEERRRKGKKESRRGEWEGKMEVEIGNVCDTGTHKNYLPKTQTYTYNKL